MRTHSVLAFTLFTIALAGLCAPGFAEDAVQFTLPHITVTGSSYANVRPDVATLQLGVVSEKPTAAEAESENATSASAVIDVLKGLGVDPKDIATASLTLSPVLIEERDPKTNQITKRTLTGYRASNILIVTIHDVGKAGSIASRVVEAGANTFQNLSFEVSDYENREDEQRANAVVVAMRRAKLFAGGAAMKLGRLLAIDPEADRNFGAEADLPTRKVEPGPHMVVIPVEPGSVRIGAQVSATWELVPE
jgi:uncharacterized protein YggE